MFTKSLIAAAAVAASLAGFAPIDQASAKTKIHVGIGFGYGGYYPHPGYGYQVGGINCWNGRKIVEWAGFHHVNAFDCGAPVYQYRARKFGDWYRVRVNLSGNIVGIKHL
jgi:hypothetical protein